MLGVTGNSDQLYSKYLLINHLEDRTPSSLLETTVFMSGPPEMSPQKLSLMTQVNYGPNITVSSLGFYGGKAGSGQTREDQRGMLSAKF